MKILSVIHPKLSVIHPKLSVIHPKFLILLAAVILGAAGQIQCNAQSIVGKWERTAMKRISIDKATGVRTDNTLQAQEMVKMMKETIEFRSDNTWIRTTTIANSTHGATINGTYTFSGQKLKMKLDPVLAEKFKQAAEDLKKNPKYQSHVKDVQGLPDAITLTSLTSSTMIWSYNGDMTIGDGANRKTYSLEEEVTYQKR
jgi:hypothetical protein